MTPPTLGELRDAVKATLCTALPEMTGYDTVPDATNLPCFIVRPISAVYAHSVGTPEDTWPLDLYVLVSLGDSGLGQDLLDDYLSSGGPKSIRDAIRRTPDLGIIDRAANVRAYVTDMSNYGGQFEAASIQHIGAVLRLLVTIRGPR